MEFPCFARFFLCVFKLHWQTETSGVSADEPCNSAVKVRAHQTEDVETRAPSFAVRLLFCWFLPLRRIICGTRCAATFPHVLTVSQRKGLCAQRQQKCFTLKPTIVSYLTNKITATLRSEACKPSPAPPGGIIKTKQDCRNGDDRFSLVLPSANLFQWPLWGRAEWCLLMITRWVLLVPFLPPHCSFLCWFLSEEGGGVSSWSLLDVWADACLHLASLIFSGIVKFKLCLPLKQWRTHHIPNC